MKLNLLTLRRILALVLLTVISPFASAEPQAAILEFSSVELGISGSFGVELDSVTQRVLNITSVSLTIDNHKYKIKDVGFGFRDEAALEYMFIGGLKNGTEVLSAGTNDFLLLWNPAVEGAYFTYSKTGMKVTTGNIATLTVAAEPFKITAESVARTTDISDSPFGVFTLPLIGGSLFNFGTTALPFWVPVIYF